MAETYANDALTTLASVVLAGDTTITVSASTGFPAVGNFRVRIDAEILLVTALAGNVWTVTRAAEVCAGAQTATNHSSGAQVAQVLTVAALVPTGRQVIAGSGLSGGGPLTADVTLANAGVVTFNGRTGGVTLTSSDVTTALGDTHVVYTDVANTFTAAPQTVVVDADGNKGLVVKAHSTTQSANLVEVQDSTGTPLSWFDATAAWFVNKATLGTAQFNVRTAGAAIVQLFSTTNLVFEVRFTGQTINYLHGANNFLLDSAGTNFGTIQNDSSDTWSLGTTSSVVALGTPCLQWTKAGLLLGQLKNTTTNAIDTGLQLYHKSTGTPAAGFGYGLLFQLDSSTTAQQPVAETDGVWATATHASRKGRWVAGAHDAATSAGAPREGFRVESDGSNPLISFYGGPAAGKPTITGTRDGNAALASLLSALAGQTLLTDSTTAGSSGGSPAGSNTWVQFNDGGSFGGSSRLTFDKTNGTLTVTASGTNNSGVFTNTPFGVNLTTANEAGYFSDSTNFVSLATGSAALKAIGQVWTDQTAAATMLGNVVGRMAIYNTSGTLIGYVPIYDSIS